ncbi:hypothetical protein EVG20_g9697 [Dentipellis fragilis]|uniref:F-box domain-containing protein n=1 Tax=Dentipellis fragilis TaxID=205917 RepID=A0A4Y9XXR7_9AGAM|nr:hypothetical protein EVG20_g9697 [Dentipellis fragilis]
MKFSLPIHSNLELLENFPLSLPLLRELVIQSGPRQNFVYTDTLPLGSASTPALRILELTGVWVPWTLPLYRGLVHLRVQLYPGPSISLSLQTFRDVLVGCPELESLHLYGVLFDADTKLSAVAATPPISLPRLQTLDFQAWKVSSTLCHYAALVMGTIASVPPTAMLSIECSTDTDVFRFASLGTASGILSFSNGRAIRTDPEMHYLLGRLPSVHSLSLRWSGCNDRNFLLLMLNGLNMQRLETLTTMGVPVSIFAGVLKRRGVGALKILRMGSLLSGDERERDAEEMARYREETERGTAFLKELVAEVDVASV